MTTQAKFEETQHTDTHTPNSRCLAVIRPTTSEHSCFYFRLLILAYRQLLPTILSPAFYSIAAWLPLFRASTRRSMPSAMLAQPLSVGFQSCMGLPEEGSTVNLPKVTPLTWSSNLTLYFFQPAVSRMIKGKTSTPASARRFMAAGSSMLWQYSDAMKSSLISSRIMSASASLLAISLSNSAPGNISLSYQVLISPRRSVALATSITVVVALRPRGSSCRRGEGGEGRDQARIRGTKDDFVGE